jgi:hypothetical protein
MRVRTGAYGGRRWDRWIIRFTGDVTGVVHVVATVGVGGTFSGVLVRH